jgi:hypothetical protein
MSSGSFIGTYESYNKNVLQYRDKTEEYLRRFDKCLTQNTVKSIIDFIDIVAEEKEHEHCVGVSRKYYYAVIFAAISTEELKRRRTYYFLFNGNSLDEIVKIFKQLEFSLWELEFDGGEQAEQRLYDMVSRYGLTPEAVYCTIAFVSKQGKDIAKKVSEIYLSHGLEWTI